MREKVLRALAFAGMHTSQLAALSENAESADSVATQIENSADLTPEDRAFYLLSVAQCYLMIDDTSEVVKFFRSRGSHSTRNWAERKGWDSFFTAWVERAINYGSDGNTHAPSKEYCALAYEAIQKALNQLDNVSDEYAKLNMYFVAERMCERVADTTGMQKCNKFVEEAIEAVEGCPAVDGEKEIRAVVSVLNFKAYEFVPCHIPDHRAKQQVETKPYAENEFEESEKLRLRAAALADRLASTSDLRRRVHRDLALWYMQLAKPQLAKKEKSVLLDLVGFKDDSVLYPQSLGCGNLLWWRKKLDFRSACGRG